MSVPDVCAWDIEDGRLRNLGSSSSHHTPSHSGQFTCRQTSVSYPVPAHPHDTYVIVFVLGGSGQHEDASGCLPLLAGDVCVVLPEQWHAYPRVCGTLTLFNLAIDRAHLHACAPLLGEIPLLGLARSGVAASHPAASHPTHVRLSPFGLSRLWPLLSTLIDEVDDPLASARPAVRTGILLQIIGLLGGSSRHSTLSTVGEDTPDGSGLPAATRYLEERYMGPISIEELAHQSGYTATYLSKKFRRSLGVSPSEYLLNLRIQHACKLLRDTHLSISAIARDVGFSDSQYFATRFHHVMGMTPSAFRARSNSELEPSVRERLRHGRLADHMRLR